MDVQDYIMSTLLLQLPPENFNIFSIIALVIIAIVIFIIILVAFSG